jgi:hypothetical protein
MTLYETPYLKIDLDDTLPGLLITWTGYTSSEHFRSGIDKIVELMEVHKITKTITDVTEHLVIGMEDQEYAVQISTRFSKEKWAVIRAIITPKDVFARFGIKQVSQAVKGQTEQNRRFFNNLEDAKTWTIMQL